MKAKQRIEKNVRQIQLLLPTAHHKRLKVYAAMQSMTIGDVLISRILDIVDPMAVEDSRAMAEQR